MRSKSSAVYGFVPSPLLAGLMLAVSSFGYSETVEAQDIEGYTARLAPGPGLGLPRDAVVGIGSASAELRGTELVVAGSFERLASPATRARVYIGKVTGMRGDPMFDLTLISGAGDGTYGGLTGSFDLSTEQVEALRAGRFHIQVHSEGAPEGHLLGWLLD